MKQGGVDPVINHVDAISIYTRTDNSRCKILADCHYPIGTSESFNCTLLSTRMTFQSPEQVTSVDLDHHRKPGLTSQFHCSPPIGVGPRSENNVWGEVTNRPMERELHRSLEKIAILAPEHLRRVIITWMLDGDSIADYTPTPGETRLLA